jgi:peroxiredoxin
MLCRHSSKRRRIDLKKWLATFLAMAGLVLPSPARAQQPAVDARIPGFTLRDVDGRLQDFSSLTGQVTVVIFFSTRCPMSNAFNYRRNQLYREFGSRIRFLVIDPNVNESIDEVRTYAKDVGFDFPVYEDVDDAAADIMGARNTTETFVLDPKGIVRYRGYIEDAPNPARPSKRCLQGSRLSMRTRGGLAAPSAALIYPHSRSDRPTPRCLDQCGAVSEYGARNSRCDHVASLSSLKINFSSPPFINSSWVT